MHNKGAKMQKMFFMNIIAFVSTGLGAYEIEVDNKTPFEVIVECNLVGWPNKSTTIQKYTTGSVNTMGWMTREVDIHIKNHITGQTHKNFLVVSYRKWGSQTGSKKFVVYAEPVLKDNKVDSVMLTLGEVTAANHLRGVGICPNDQNQFFISSKEPLQFVKK